MPDATSGERLRAYVLRQWKGGRGMVGLSEASGIARDRLYAWFRGDVEPTLGSLGELAAALNVRRAEVVAAIDGELPPPNWRDDLRAVIAETQKEAAPEIPGRLDKIDQQVHQLTVGLALMSPALAEAMRQAAIEAAETPGGAQRGAKRQGRAGRR